MQCPHDQSVLVMTERKGVEIDYCPQCRGVWLDRGELDKIVDRTMEAEIAAEAGTPMPPAGPAYGGPSSYAEVPRYEGRRDDRDRYGDDPRYRKRRKKDSWLEDLFDF